MFSDSEIKTIHNQSKAIYNKKYVTLDGKVYIGLKSGKLQLDKTQENKLKTTGVIEGTYGDADSVGQFTVDDKGRLTNAQNVDISITSSSITDFTEAAQDAIGSSLTDTTTIDLTYDDAANTIEADFIGDTDDVPEGATNQYFTNERAQDAVGTILTDTASVNFTYDDAGNQITADVLLTGITHNLLSATHSDTVAASPVRGDIIVGDSTPAWTKLATGATGTVLIGGTDPSYSSSPIISTSVTTPILIGSTAASGTLTLRATSNATDGAIIFESDPTTERARILSTGEFIVGSSTLIGTEFVSFQKSQNAGTDLQIKNNTNGTGAYARIIATNSAGVGIAIGITSPTYTTSGIHVANTAVINTSASNGMNIGTSSNTEFAVYTNNTKRIRLKATGELSIGSSFVTTEYFNVFVNQNASTQAIITNETSGTAASALLYMRTLTSNFLIQAFSAGFTTSGIKEASSGALYLTSGNSLNIGTNNSAPTTFWTNNTKRWIVAATTGNLSNTGSDGTAYIHLKAGTSSASTAPIKLTSGTNMTAAEAGAIEFTTDDLYFTITTGAARKGFVLNDGTNLTSGRIPFATTNGRLTDDADLTFATDTLTATKIIGTTSVKVGTAAGYISSDGSTGATGSFVAGAVTVTVKDGIITSIV